MIQYLSVKVRLLDSYLYKLKSVTKNATDITVRLLSNMTGTNETDFAYNLLLTNMQVSSLCKAFANNALVNAKLYQKRNHRNNTAKWNP